MRSSYENVGMPPLDNFLDKGERIEIASELEPKDFLNFKDLKRYKERLVLAQEKYWRKKMP